jgi:hypothetical protein
MVGTTVGFQNLSMEALGDYIVGTTTGFQNLSGAPHSII